MAGSCDNCFSRLQGYAGPKIATRLARTHQHRTGAIRILHHCYAHRYAALGVLRYLR